MRVEVRLYAICRERAGADRISLELAGATATLAELRDAVAVAYPTLRPLLPVVRVAVNQAFADEDTPIHAGDELALIPPVSGGSGLGCIELRQEPITLAEVEEAVRCPSAGAVVSFAGTVRDQTQEHAVLALEYEAYAEMAQRCLRTIAGEICARWPGARAAILHRVGRLSVGEISVAIAVSHPHRAAAFAACSHAIERLKQDVPIWKKEIRRDGSIWVGMGS